MKILAVGDSFMPTRYFAAGFRSLAGRHDILYFQVDEHAAFAPSTRSEHALREFQGSPDDVASQMVGVEVLVVHGAPVSEQVLDASRALRLVCCARGGPVNVDLEALAARRLPLVITPGKNADAVADLTLAFLVMLARGLPKAQRFFAEGKRVRNTFDGAVFFGNDLRGHTLGLVGFGRIGRRVAGRAVAFGTSVVVYDPHVEADSTVEQVATLEELLRRSDFVSLHARATPHNENLIDADALALMKPGSFLVNTARETLIDEDALDAALSSGQLAGAALDVVRSSEPTGQPHRLLRHGNVVMTPHVGGATYETLLEGAQMVASEIERFAVGEPLINVVYPHVAAA